MDENKTVEKRVLLIADTKSFMVNAIIKELEEALYEVQTTTAAVNAIGRIKDVPDIFLLYLESADGMSELLTYLKDRIAEEEKSLIVIMKSEDEDEFYGIIPRDRVAAAFLRPFNVKLLKERLEEITELREMAAAKKKILVVDDDGTMLRTIKNWLSSKYQVYMVNSGMEAIRFLVNNSVDLILLDYEMPVTNGPQVLKMLRSDSATSNIPVMFLTVKSDKESVMQVVALKPEKYLLKTMTREELIANVDEFFEQQRIRTQMSGY